MAHTEHAFQAPVQRLRASHLATQSLPMQPQPVSHLPLVWSALLLLTLVGAGVCFAFFIATNNLRYRRWGMQLLQYALLTALAFFGMLILSRIL